MRLQYNVTAFVTTFVVLFVTSCTCEEAPSEPNGASVPTVVEPGLAYGVPCKPPCWRGLTPGDSTRQEAAQAVEHLQAEGWADHVVDGSAVGGGYSISPSPFTSRGTVHVEIEGDIVATIHVSSLLFDYSVGVLMEQFGAPEGLHVVSEGGTTCSSCERWEPPTVGEMSSPVHLLFPEQGLWFLALVPVSGMGCICPEMEVTAFCYYAPMSMKAALGDNHLAGLCAGTLTDVNEDDIMEWHGFGGGY